MSSRPARSAGSPDAYLLGPVDAPDPVQERAALRAVMYRIDSGELDRADAYTVLSALGLIKSPGGGRYNPATGRRVRPSQMPKGRTKRKKEEGP